jgi:hypothetical protein
MRVLLCLSLCWPAVQTWGCGSWFWQGLRIVDEGWIAVGTTLYRRGVDLVLGIMEQWKRSWRVH